MSKRDIIKEIKRDLNGKADYISFKYITVKEIYDLLKKREAVVRCMDCIHFDPENAEEGDSSGHCRNRYAPCENQTVDMWWFCAGGIPKEE